VWCNHALKGVSHGSEIVLVKTHECRAIHGYGTHVGHTLSLKRLNSGFSFGLCDEHLVVGIRCEFPQRGGGG